MLGNRKAQSNWKKRVFIPITRDGICAPHLSQGCLDKFTNSPTSAATSDSQARASYEPRNTAQPRRDRGLTRATHRLNGDLVFFDISANGKRSANFFPLSGVIAWNSGLAVPVKAYRSFDFFSQIDRELSIPQDAPD